MKKSVLFIAFLSLIFMKLVSAQYYGSYGYGSFRLDDYINPDFVFYSLAWLFFFWILSVVLSRIPLFKSLPGEKGTKQSVVGALIISTIITYWIYRTGFGLEGLFYNLGFSEGVFGIVLSVVLLIAVCVVAWKWGLKALFLLSGVALFGVSLTDLVYEKTTVSILGAGLFLIGLWLWKRKRDKEKMSMGASPQPGGDGSGQDAQPNRKRKAYERNVKNRIIFLRKKFIDIQRQNPNDPRLVEIVKELKELKGQLG
ncbi:MAG: hypothetical protein Q8P81_00775 [Nanoarchaeota archaeon]|nr:hypothetical protein [Nanoarchaeota archaeon]